MLLDSVNHDWTGYNKETWFCFTVLEVSDSKAGARAISNLAHSQWWWWMLDVSWATSAPLCGPCTWANLSSFIVPSLGSQGTGAVSSLWPSLGSYMIIFALLSIGCNCHNPCLDSEMREHRSHLSMKEYILGVGGCSHLWKMQSTTEPPLKIITSQSLSPSLSHMYILVFCTGTATYSTGSSGFLTCIWQTGDFSAFIIVWVNSLWW